ncbi:HAD hydrolase-like protein [Candidatus Saccharibacteria bacterium]|nr:MAG: HAD hydrolase-like protein [Candidatus Saccharibacteria bacterium]
MSRGCKDTDLFALFVNTFDAKQTVFIGDRVRSELAVGNVLGATTIWVKQGKFANELPELDSEKPTSTVASLTEVKNLLTKLQQVKY